MSTRDQKVDVVFERGLDTKTSEHLVPPVRFTELENGYWHKTGKLEKRLGFDDLTQDIAGGGTLSNAVALKTHNDELLQIANHKLYSFSEESNKWLERGGLTMAKPSQKTVSFDRNGRNIADSIVKDSIEVYVWVDRRRSDTASLEHGSIRASIYDNDSDTWVVEDEQLIDDIDCDDIQIRCVYVDDKIFVLYNDKSSLRYRTVDTSDPSSGFSSETSLFACTCFDAIPYNDTYFVLVWAGSNDIHMDLLTSAGVRSQYGFTSDGTAAKITNLCAALQPTSNDVYVAYNSHINTGNRGIYGVAFYIASSNAKITATAIDVVTVPAWNGQNYTGRVGCVFEDASTFHIYYEQQGTDEDGQLNIYRPVVQHITTNGSLVSNADKEMVFAHSRLLSRPWLYDSNIYVNVATHWTVDGSRENIQHTVFTYQQDSGIVCKFLPSETSMMSFAAPQQDISQGNVANVCNEDSGIYTFCSPAFGVRGLEIVHNLSRPSPNHGLVRLQLDFNADIISEKVGDNTYFLPGLLHEWDGVNLVENGFHLYPEVLKDVSDSWLITVTDGDASNPELTKIACPDSGNIKTNDYLTIYDATNAARNFLFSVDGETHGASPTFEGTISVNSYDTPDEIATAVAAAVNASSYFSAVVNSTNLDEVDVTNGGNGNVTDASVTLVSGSLSDGTYGYRAIYRWIDNNGQVHRSAPSPILSVTLSGGTSTQSISVQVPCTPATRKDAVIEVYRTQSNGTTFYKVSDDANPLFNRIDGEFTYFIDTEVSDTDLIDNEILYTEGGTLDNIAPPAASSITANKRLVFLGGVPGQEHTVWHSKQKVNGLGIEFSDSFTLDTGAYSSEITGLCTLDEKLLIFNRKSTMWTIGDGYDDLGQGQGFNKPQFISHDTGLDAILSLAQASVGVFFKSKRGYYVISRGLEMTYIGSPVEDYNDLTVRDATVMPKSLHQIRWVNNDGNALVYDWYHRQWSTFTNYGADGSALISNQYYILKDSGEVWKEKITFDILEPVGYAYRDPENTHISMKATTGWLQLNNINGFQRVKRAEFLGLFDSDYTYTIRTYVNYEDSIKDTYTNTPDAVAGTEKQIPIHLATQKCEAMKFSIFDTGGAGDYATMEVTGLSLIVGRKKGIDKRGKTRAALAG